MKQIIVYIMVFCLTLYCFFLYDDVILTILLIMEAVYLLILFTWLIYINNRINVSMDSVIPIADKNQKIPITFTLQNHSEIFSAHVRVLLQIENSFTGERKRISKSGSVKKNGIETLTFILEAQSCGNLTVSMKEYWIYDILSIFKIRRRKTEIQQIGILPECHLIPVEVTRKTREFIADADEYSDRESGDDPSEIYQIRAYREKDSLHDVHWKLSAKADELLVKEHGRPLGCVVLIWLNLQVNKKIKKIFLAEILEVAASLSMSLLEQKCVHMVAWYEEENQKIQKKRISKEEHIYELLSRLLYTTAYQENVERQFEEAFRGMEFSTTVEIRADGKVFVNQEEKMELYFIV